VEYPDYPSLSGQQSSSTAVYRIIRKGNDAELPVNVLACPRFKTPLKKVGGMLFSPEALVVYPIVGCIPCLRIENGILASKYEEVIKTG